MKNHNTIVATQARRLEAKKERATEAKEKANQKHRNKIFRIWLSLSEVRRVKRKFFNDLFKDIEECANSGKWFTREYLWMEMKVLKKIWDIGRENCFPFPETISGCSQDFRQKEPFDFLLSEIRKKLKNLGYETEFCDYHCHPYEKFSADVTLEVSW